MQPRTAHVRVDTHVGTHVLHNHGWDRHFFGSAAQRTNDNWKRRVSPNGLTSLPRLSSPHTHITHTHTHQDKQDTKPRAKGLAGLGKAFPDVRVALGASGASVWAAFLGCLGISTGPCRQVHQVPRRKSTPLMMDLDFLSCPPVRPWEGGPASRVRCHALGDKRCEHICLQSILCKERGKGHAWAHFTSRRLSVARQLCSFPHPATLAWVGEGAPARPARPAFTPDL